MAARWLRWPAAAVVREEARGSRAGRASRGLAGPVVRGRRRLPRGASGEAAADRADASGYGRTCPMAAELIFLGLGRQEIREFSRRAYL